MGRLTPQFGMLAYLDANVFIYAVEDAGPLGDVVRDVFTRIDRGEFVGLTSELTLSEVLVRPIRNGDLHGRREFELLLADRPTLGVVPVDRDVLIRAAEVRAASTLKLPDAIHAATALDHGCTSFPTNDARFAAYAPLPVLLASDLP